MNLELVDNIANNPPLIIERLNQTQHVFYEGKVWEIPPMPKWARYCMDRGIEVYPPAWGMKEVDLQSTNTAIKSQ